METSALAATTKTSSPLEIDGARERVLPSGRSLRVRADEAGEEIEVRSPEGTMEIRIALTDEGPVLSLRGVRLKIDATSTIDVSCRDLAIRAQDKIHLRAGALGLRSAGEIRMKSGQQTFIDGDYVNLNCLSRKGYHDYVPADKIVDAPPDPPALPGAGTGEDRGDDGDA